MHYRDDNDRIIDESIEDAVWEAVRNECPSCRPMQHRERFRMFDDAGERVGQRNEKLLTKSGRLLFVPLVCF